MRMAVLAFVAMALLAGCPNTVPDGGGAAGEKLGPGINTLIGEVQKALVDVRRDPLVQENLPELNHVELELNTGFDTEGNLKINLFFLEVGGGASASESQTIKLTMAPPPRDKTMALSSPGPDTLAAQFSRIIRAAAVGVVGAGDSEVPLEASGLEIALKIGVTKKAGVGASFEIAPVTVGGGASVNVAQVPTITLVFKE